MIETLYANGCSWTAGGEIFPAKAGYNDSRLKAFRTENTYPKHMADILNIKHVVNDALEGGSNDRIFRTTLSFIGDYLSSGKDPSKLFVVIGWTTGTRTEVFLKPHKNKPGYFQHVQAQFQPFFGAEPQKDIAKAVDSWRKLYAAYFAHDEGENDIWISKAYSLQCVMVANNIPFLFTSALNPYKLDEWKTNAHQKNLDGLLDTVRNIGPKDSFIHHVHHNNLPVEEYKHPSIEAHKSWGAYLAQYVKTHNLLETPNAKLDQIPNQSNQN